MSAGKASGRFRYSLLFLLLFSFLGPFLPACDFDTSCLSIRWTSGLCPNAAACLSPRQGPLVSFLLHHEGTSYHTYLRISSCFSFRHMQDHKSQVGRDRRADAPASGFVSYWLLFLISLQTGRIVMGNPHAHRRPLFTSWHLPHGTSI